MTVNLDNARLTKALRELVEVIEIQQKTIDAILERLEALEGEYDQAS
jgi:hypothetical protein